MIRLQPLRTVLLGLLLLPLLPGQAATPPKGFTPLFNGKDFTGWYGWGTRNPQDLWKMTPEERAAYKKTSVQGDPAAKADPKKTPEHILAHWSIQGDEIVNDGKGLYLTTEKDYGDFELMVEYKALPDGDSGIYLRGLPQVQIWDSTKGDPRKLGQDKGSGGLWNNSPGAPGKDPSKKMDKPFGEWNQFKIRMVGDRVRVVFNGETVVDNAPLENYFGRKAFEDAKKAGKLTDPNAFADPAFLKGPIQLQTHGSEIRWRNLFIREIPASEANRILAGNEKGFKRLDNGKDLKGWKGAVENYEVVDGAIVCKKGKGGNLLSEEEYGDMILQFEFKLPSGGNNGIALRTPLNGHPAADGLEIQVIDNEGYDAAHPKAPLKDYQRHGSIYHCVGAKPGYLRPVGQWNHEEIRVEGQRITVTVNGFKILDADLTKIDRSKLDKAPGGLDRTSGHVGFAGHNDPVAFRNVRVKRLGAAPAATAKTAPAEKKTEAAAPAKAATPAPAPATAPKAEAPATAPKTEEPVVAETVEMEPVVDEDLSYLEEELVTDDGKKKKGGARDQTRGNRRPGSIFGRTAFLSHPRQG
jgi:hypothetical protein